MALKANNIHAKPTRKVGFLLRTHGYKGQIKLSLEDDDFDPTEFLLVSINEKFVPYRIENYNEEAGIVKLKGIDSIEAANLIVGKPILDFVIENEGSDVDYRAYTLIDSETKKEYRITEIVEMPNQTLIEFRNGFKDTLLPFHPDLIVGIDEEKKTITASFPDGILDL